MKNKFIMSGCKHYIPDRIQHRLDSVKRSSVDRVVPKFKSTVYTVNGIRMKFSSSVHGALLTDEGDPNHVTIFEIKNYFFSKADNGRIMITMCDKGYLDVFRLFYRLNHMEQYKNFVAVVLDKAGYDVSVFALYNDRFCLKKGILSFITRMIFYLWMRHHPVHGCGPQVRSARWY